MRSPKTSLSNRSSKTVVAVMTINFVQNSMYYLNTCDKPLCGFKQEQPVLTRNHRLCGFYVSLNSSSSPQPCFSLPQQHTHEFSSHGNPLSSLAATRKRQNSIGFLDKALFNMHENSPGKLRL